MATTVREKNGPRRRDEGLGALHSSEHGHTVIGAASVADCVGGLGVLESVVPTAPGPPSFAPYLKPVTMNSPAKRLALWSTIEMWGATQAVTMS